MRKNIRTGIVVIGLLFIIAACIAAYITTKPSEADISLRNGMPKNTALSHKAFESML